MKKNTFQTKNSFSSTISFKYFLILLFSMIISLSYAQQNSYTKASDSDVEALKIMEKSKGILNNAKSLIFDYTFITRIPDSEPNIQNGIAKQKDNMYYLEIGNQTVYCNGKSVKVFFQIQNEVQINDFEEDSELLTPASILNSFDKKNYIYVLGEDKKEKGKRFYNLMLKPTAKYSEYSKIVALIDKKTFLPYKLQMYYKDGTKNTLKVNSVKMNQVIKDDVFSFDETKHPNISIEDFRMD